MSELQPGTGWTIFQNKSHPISSQIVMTSPGKRHKSADKFIIATYQHIIIQLHTIRRKFVNEIGLRQSKNDLFLPKNSIMIASELQNTLIREILAIQNTAVLRKLDSYLKKIKQEDRADLSDYERRVIEIGLSQVNEGKFITDEEVSRKTKEWLDE